MTKAGIKDRQERSVLLSKLPDGAARVKVETATGETHYKAVADLADTDTILTKDDGTPIVMRSTPGRRKNVVIEPANATIKEILRRKEEFVEDDPLRRVTREDPESPDVLQHIMVRISEEAASIAFERREADRTGKDTSTLSHRSILAMRALGETWLKRREQVSARGIDLDSPAFEAVFGYTMETFKEAMNASKARPEMIETVFAKLSQMINDEWKAEAKTRMKKLV
jgi:hypothetical protein